MDELKGIEAALAYKLSQRSKEELIRDTLSVYKLAGENILELGDTKDNLAEKDAYIKTRNSAGANARAEGYQGKKDKFTSEYNALKAANNDKNPSYKVLCNGLEKLHPDEDWSVYTCVDWHKKLNKGTKI